ncbi:MAG: hydantoinase B/oxoprolinase family protein [Gemmatimonadetes bacterium]|nr:hydantoinase B/oxoprolinase family protein [Gemmatimonadota bacterium]
MERLERGVAAVRLEVYRHLFTALAEEMGAALRRSAHSPNIKERRDYSCALFDGAGRVVAQGDHMPVHLGALPLSVAAVLEELGPLGPGDIAALNDPFRGGTHLPDITLVSGVWLQPDPDPDPDPDPVRGRRKAGSGSGSGWGTERGRPLAYLAARAHHADVGGMAPGSMPLARELYQEGLVIPPIRLYARGRRAEAAWRLILANVRTPAERAGDLAGQVAALATGERRLRELVARRGVREVRAAMASLLEYADRLVRAGIARIPAGVYEAEDFLDDDGFGSGPLRVRVRVTVRRGELHVDFTGTAPQTEGGVNAVAAITTSCARYVLRCVVEALLEQPLPAGGGEMRALRLVLPPGSLVAARAPASVAGGNVETSQRITDVLFAALAQALPELIPAQSQGTMNNLTAGGVDPRTGQPFAYYETVGGGMGAGPQGPGLSGVHVHMTNSLNTPIEALEHAYPLRVRRYQLRRGTGGAGRHRGGDGLRRDVELLCDADVSLLTERRARPPAGAAGGGPGATGSNVLIRGGREHELPAKTTLQSRAGDIISIRTPGGGGWGVP